LLPASTTWLLAKLEKLFIIQAAPDMLFASYSIPSTSLQILNNLQGSSSMARIIAKAMLLILGTSALAGISQAQSVPDCPLSGAIYPAPAHVLESTIITKAVRSLKDNLNQALADGTLSAANASFHLEVFSADQLLLEYSYAAPDINSSLTAGVLNKDTIFRIRSVSKFIEVYTLLAATGFKYINDPITKWVPELAAAFFANDSAINKVRWHDITVGALAGHQAGLLKDCT
jgi:CubicO group peptidase (beta-lactamase class C family)